MNASHPPSQVLVSSTIASVGDSSGHNVKLGKLMVENMRHDESHRECGTQDIIQELFGHLRCAEGVQVFWVVVRQRCKLKDSSVSDPPKGWLNCKFCGA